MSRLMEYIEREDAVKIASRYGCSNGSVLGRHSGLADSIASEIDQLPAADVAPVRHGRWVRIRGMAPPEYHGRHMCSICYARALDIKCQEELSGYCPNCGAKMDGGE